VQAWLSSPPALKASGAVRRGPDLKAVIIEEAGVGATFCVDLPFFLFSLFF
jgi:hypothetical protein